ncbi:MAG: hypothetical protein Q8P68_04610 [Candidatus Peregrinibacteria bacterium]|nr:hypothetical protein [Candidatus Peregrinibacteria bacterium]MDZ4244884.1 hypothetical protein [Candidatus Gracilibacteria bacterium]
MEISNFFTFGYYFNLTPTASILSIFIAIYFVALFVLRAHLRLLAAKHQENKLVRKLQKKHLQKLALIGILGLLTIGARHLSIPLFGMRIIAYMLILWSIYEIWQIVSVHKKKAYAQAHSSKKKMVTDKYIPVPKKKTKKKR